MSRLVYADPGRTRAAVQAAVAEARAKGMPLVAVIRTLTRALKGVGLPWADAQEIAQTLVHIALSELPPTLTRGAHDAQTGKRRPISSTRSSAFSHWLHQAAFASAPS
jgi:hypothetical protein